MPGIEVGSAYARFLLELAEFRESVAEARSTLTELREEAKAPIVAKFTIVVDKSQLTAIARSIQKQEQEELRSNPIVVPVAVKLNPQDVRNVKKELKQLNLETAIAAAGGGQTALSATQAPTVDRTASIQAKTALEEARKRAENAKAAAEETTRLQSELNMQRRALNSAEHKFRIAEAEAAEQAAAAALAANQAREAAQQARQVPKREFTEVSSRRAVLEPIEKALAKQTNLGLQLQAESDKLARNYKALGDALAAGTVRENERGETIRQQKEIGRRLARSQEANIEQLNVLNRLQAERGIAQQSLNEALARQAQGLELPELSQTLANHEQKVRTAAGVEAEQNATLTRIRQERIEAENRLTKATQAKNAFFREHEVVSDNDELEATRKALAKEQRSAAQAAGRLRNQEETAQNDALRASHNLGVARDNLARQLQIEIAEARQFANASQQQRTDVERARERVAKASAAKEKGESEHSPLEHEYERLAESVGQSYRFMSMDTARLHEAMLEAEAALRRFEATLPEGKFFREDFTDEQNAERDRLTDLRTQAGLALRAQPDADLMNPNIWQAQLNEAKRAVVKSQVAFKEIEAEYNAARLELRAAIATAEAGVTAMPQARLTKKQYEEGRGPQLSFADAPSNDTAAAEALRLKNEMGELTAEIARTEEVIATLMPAANALTQAELDVAAALQALETAINVETAAVSAPTSTAPEIVQHVASNVAAAPAPVIPVDATARDLAMSEVRVARERVTAATKAAEQYGRLEAELALQRAKFLEAERSMLLAERQSIQRGASIYPAKREVMPADAGVIDAAIRDLPGMGSIRADTRQAAAIKQEAADKVKGIQRQLDELGRQGQSSVQLVSEIKVAEAELGVAIREYEAALRTEQLSYNYAAKEFEEHAAVLRRRGQEVSQENLLALERGRRDALRADKPFLNAQMLESDAALAQAQAEREAGKARIARQTLRGVAPREDQDRAQAELEAAEAALTAATEKLTRSRIQRDNAETRVTQDFRSANLREWEDTLPRQPDTIATGAQARADEMRESMAKATTAIDAIVPKMNALGDVTGELTAAQTDLTTKEKAAHKASVASDQFLPEVIPHQQIALDPAVAKYQQEVDDHRKIIQEEAEIHREATEEAKVAIAKGRDNLGAERRAGDALSRLADSQHKLGFSYLNLQRAVDMATRHVEGETDYYRKFAAENPDVKDPAVEIAKKRRDRAQKDIAEAEVELAEKTAAFDAMKAKSSAGGRDRRQEGDIDGGTAQNEWENAEWRVTSAKQALAKEEEKLAAAIQTYEAAQQERTDAINKAAQAASVDAAAIAAQAAAPTVPRRISRVYDSTTQPAVPAQAAAPAAPGAGATLPASLASVDQASALAHVAKTIGEVADQTARLTGLDKDAARLAVAKANANKQYADSVTILRDQLRRVGDDLPRQIALTNQLARAEAQDEQQKRQTALAAREQAIQQEKLALAHAKATGDPQAVVSALEGQLTVAQDAGDIPRQIELINQLTTAETALAASIKRTAAEERAAAVATDAQVVSYAKLIAAQGDYDAALGVLSTRLGDVALDEERSANLVRQMIRLSSEQVKVEGALEDAITRRHLAGRDLQPALQQNLAEQAKLPPENQRNLAEKQRAAELGVEQAEIERRIADEVSRHARALIGLDRVERDYAGALAIVRDGLKRMYNARLPLEQQTTAYINLKKLERQIEIDAERETRKVADADIAAAKAAKDRTLAQELLNAELERTRNLPTHLGGAGGAGSPPGPNGGSPLIPDDDRTPRIAQLQKESQVIAAMPTFWSRAAAGALRYVGPLALVTLGYRLMSGAAQEARTAIDTIGSNDLATRQLQALFNNMQRGTDTMDSAIRFGREFNRTQKEMGEAAGEAGIILQTTSVEAGKAFEIIERLRTRAPQQNFAAGVRSIAELQSGQLQSIERVFNVPRRFAKEMSDAIKQGEDPLLAVDRVLNKLGQTSELLEAQTQGPLAGFKALGVASERLAVDIGHGLMPILQASAGELARNANSASVFMENIGRVPNVSNIVKAYEEIWRAHHRAFEEGDAAGVLRNDPFSVTGTLARAVEMQRDEDLRNERLERTALTIEQIRTNALQAAPALAQFLDVAQVEKEAAAVVDLNGRVNALVARFTSEQSTAQEFFTQIQKARKETGDIDVDPSLAIEGIKNIASQYSTVEDRVAALTVLAGQFSRAMGDPSLHLSDKLGADLEAVVAEIVRLNAMLPIDIEIRLKRVEQFTAFTNAVTSAGDTMTKALKDNETALTQATDQNLQDRTQAYIDYVTNVAKLNDQLVRSQKRANDELAYNQQLALDNFGDEQQQSIVDRNSEKILNEREFYRSADQQRAEFERGQNQARDAFNRQELRSNEDYQRQLDRQGEDRAVAQFRKERDRRKEDERDEKQHRDTLLRMQRDYMIDAARSYEDFELERLVLLAEGRIAEAQVLQSRFEVERRRKAEDFSRDVSDLGDQHGAGQADRAAQRQQEDQDAAEDQKRADDRAKADRERQVRQQREDFEFQQALADQNQKHQAELAEANYRRQVELQDQQFNEQFARREAQFAKQQEAERAALAHQQELERADRDQAVIDAGTAFDAQLAAIDKRLADEVQKYKDKRDEIVNEFDAAYVEQERLLALHQKEIDRIEQLKADGIDEKEAEAIGHLETARDEYERVLGETKEHFKNFTVTDEIDRINREIAGLLAAARGEGTPVAGEMGDARGRGAPATVVNPNEPDRTKDDTYIPPASIVPKVAAVQTQRTAVARETAAYIATERTKDDTFIRNTETALTKHNDKVLSETDIQQQAIAGIFTDKQSGITATVTTEQRKVETVVHGTNERVKDDTVTKQQELHRETVTHTAGQYDLYANMNKDILANQSSSNTEYNEEQETERLIRQKATDREFGDIFNSAVSWSFKTLDTIGKMINQVMSGVPAAAGAAGQAAFGPVNTYGGVIGNDKSSDDPRISGVTLIAGFGEGATLTATYDSQRKSGEGVPVPGTTHDAHAGLDVTMTRGSRVKCPIKIWVSKVSPDEFGSGTTILGEDSFGRQWLFAHLNRVTVKPGDIIQQGEYMGVIGTAGHVHVQLRNDPDVAIPVDPTQALEEAQGVGLPDHPADPARRGTPGGDALKGQSQTSFQALSTNPVQAGTAWGLTFRDAAATQMAPLTLDILPNIRDMDPLNALSLHANTLGGANRPATIHVHVHNGPVTMDGRTVGEIVTPYVDEIMADGVQGAADVQNAVYTPGTYQSAFRRPN